jgi:hypothetical protein
MSAAAGSVSSPDEVIFPVPDRCVVTHGMTLSQILHKLISSQGSFVARQSNEISKPRPSRRSGGSRIGHCWHGYVYTRSPTTKPGTNVKINCSDSIHPENCLAVQRAARERRPSERAGVSA